MEKNIGKEVVEDLNINDEFPNFLNIHGESVYLQVHKLQEKSISLLNDRESYYDSIRAILPKNKEIWDEQLRSQLKDFIDILVEKICIANYKWKVDARFSDLMKKKIDDVKKKKSEESRRKIESKRKIEQKLRFLYNKDLERIRQINRLYEIDENLTQFKMKKYEAYGEGNNRFYFVSASNKEHPVEYAKRIIVESVNKSRLKGFDKKSTSEIFKIYATTQLLLDNLKDSIQLSYVFETINNLKELK